MTFTRWVPQLRQWLALACLAALPLAAGAQDVVRQFLSELMLHESQAVLQDGRPVRYRDGEAGERLRRLLDPARTRQVVDEMQASLRRGEGMPDFSPRMKPLADRYSKAFEQWPADYETEYLDLLYWSVQTVKFALENMTTQPASTPAAPPEVSQLLASGRSLMIGVTGLMERSIRQKVESNAFSPDGRARATAMADELASARSPLLAARMRPLYEGEDVYRQHCAACHDTGVAGAPRRGDHAAWRQRIARGFAPLMQATLVGKGAMPPQIGGGVDNIELARATVYLANSAGGSFPEPDLPPTHSGMVAVQEPTLPPAAPARSPMTGEKLYAMNCEACHVQGQQVGPMPALRGAKSLQSGDSAIRIVLHGKGVMPAWRMLSDQEIALVTNYVIERFGSRKLPEVTAQQVRKLR